MADDDTTESDILAALRRTEDGSTWQRLFQGFLLPFRGVRFLLGHYSLWHLIILPVLIHIALFGGAMYLLISNADVVLDWIWLEPVVESWYDWAETLAWYVLFTIICLLSIVASYIFVLLVGGIVASPFNDRLSERAEPMLMGHDPPSRDGSLIWEAIRGIGSSIFILGSYCIVMLPILLLNLVPAVGQVAATILGAGVSSMFLSMEFTDSSLDRRGHGLRQKFELIEANRDVALGFGLGTSFFIWIPVFNLLTIPFAVIGGTALGIVLDEWDSKERRARRQRRER